MNVFRLQTDSLGFPLELEVTVDPDLDVFGKQISFEDAEGNVVPTALHRIYIRGGIELLSTFDTVAHESYHLFYALRPHITADEETQAEVFGNLVRRLMMEIGLAGVVERSDAVSL